MPSLLLTPKGKVDSCFRLVRVGDDAWLDVEAGFGDALRAALERFKLRVKVEITVPDGPWGMLALRGHAAVHAVPAPPESGAVLPVAWPAAAGIDVIGPHAALDDLPAAADGLDADAYERMRIEAGVPRLGRDLDERTIPQEAWLERDAVSFTKGCFLGQELVARIDSRGHVNRQLRRLRAGDGAAALAPGAEIIVDGHGRRHGHERGRRSRARLRPPRGRPARGGDRRRHPRHDRAPPVRLTPPFWRHVPPSLVGK